MKRIPKNCVIAICVFCWFLPFLHLLTDISLRLIIDIWLFSSLFLASFITMLAAITRNKSTLVIAVLIAIFSFLYEILLSVIIECLFLAPGGDWVAYGGLLPIYTTVSYVVCKLAWSFQFQKTKSSNETENSVDIMINKFGVGLCLLGAFALILSSAGFFLSYTELPKTVSEYTYLPLNTCRRSILSVSRLMAIYAVILFVMAPVGVSIFSRKKRA